jgi:hypothetical protein
MARGDFVLFEEFVANFGDGEHDLSADTFKVGIVDETAPVPVAGSAGPTWDDFSGNEVSAAGGYVADGITLTTVTYVEAGGTGTFNADNIALSLDAGGFENAYWAILYNDTNATDMAIGFVELDGPVSERTGPIAINWNASGIFTVAIV